MLRKIPVGILLLVLSVGLNVTLSRRVSTLTHTVEALKGGSRLKIGTKLADIQAQDLEGKIRTVRYSDSSVPTLLYVFSPSCGWCYRNLENVRLMSQDARGRYRMVGLSLSDKGLPEYIKDHRIDFPVYVPSEQIRRDYRLGGTPETLLVAADGRVTKIWTGAYQAELKKESRESSVSRCQD